MMNRFFLCFIVSVALLVACSKDEPIAESPFKPGSGDGDDLPANCNVELVTVDRITADEVTEDAALGDYFFTLKSVNTVKESISVEGRYAKNGAAVAIVTVSRGNVGIDETIVIKISSKDINTEEDFNCMEYLVKVKAKDTRDCEYNGTDC